MKYKIEWLEKKSEEWFIVSLTDESGKQTTDVSINAKSKTGESFPYFAELKAGETVEGELWQSQKNKWYLFPPKPVNTQSKPNFTPKTGMIKQAQERKEQMISVAQGNKELGIKISSTMRMAVDCALGEYNSGRGYTYGDSLGENIKGWRKWLWEHWEAEDKDFEPFPSNDDY